MAKRSPSRWTQEMNDMFNHLVNRPVLTNKSVRNGQEFLYGFPKKYVYDEVIKKGLGDFKSDVSDPRYGNLTTDQIARLYCYFHMKQHFFAAKVNFELAQSLLALNSSKQFVTLIDIGCGPGTAGLAFAEVFSNTPFAYIGIDRAAPALTMAKRFFDAGALFGLISNASTFDSSENWDNRLLPNASKQIVILNFSYFFGSQFLTTIENQQLADLYLQLKQHPNVARIFISYCNSTHDLANQKYRVFLNFLGIDFDSHPPRKVTFEYYVDSKSTKTKPPVEMYCEVFET